MKRRLKNSRFEEKLDFTGEKTISTLIHLIHYSENHLEELKTSDLDKVHIQKDCINWIRVTGMNDSILITDLLEKLGLDTLDTNKILTKNNKVVIEELNENMLIAFNAISYNSENQLQTDRISFILGENYVITFQECDNSFFNQIYSAIKNKMIKTEHKGADFLLATIVCEILEAYADTVIQLEDSLENIEDQLLNFDESDNGLMKVIQEKRRQVIHLRKNILPLKEHFPELLRSEKKLIHKNQFLFYKDLNYQIGNIIQNIESCKEIISSLVDLFLNNNDLRMNLIMKQLTMVATMFIPLTFFVGVWGMNFDHMPELRFKYGYFIAWIIMIVTAWWIWKYFKKKNWF